MGADRGRFGLDMWVKAVVFAGDMWVKAVVLAGRFALGAMQFDGTVTRAVCVCVCVCVCVSSDINVASLERIQYLYTYIRMYICMHTSSNSRSYERRD